MNHHIQILYAGVIVAVVSLSVFLLTGFNMARTEGLAGNQGELEATAINKDKPYWDADRPKTGQVSILALEISPQATYKEVKYGKVPWLDAAVANAGQNTAVDEVKLKEFFKYTEDGNTDFKVVFDDKSEKYYRLYFMEVP